MEPRADWAQGLGGSQVQELLSPSGWRVSPYQYADVFSNPEALRTTYNWDFMEASSCRHDQSLTPFPAPLPSLEDAGRGLKIPSF